MTANENYLKHMKRLFHTGAILVFMLFSASMTLAQSRYCQVDPGGTSIQVKEKLLSGTLRRIS